MSFEVVFNFSSLSGLGRHCKCFWVFGAEADYRPFWGVFWLLRAIVGRFRPDSSVLRAIIGFFVGPYSVRRAIVGRVFWCFGRLSACAGLFFGAEGDYR